jgi:hypothetical protein
VCGTDPGYSAREKMMKNHGLISSFFVMFCAFFMRAICVNADFVKMHVGDAGMLPSGTSSFPRGYQRLEPKISQSLGSIFEQSVASNNESEISRDHESTPVQLRARRDPFRLPDARNIGLTPSARNSLPIN